MKGSFRKLFLVFMVIFLLAGCSNQSPGVALDNSTPQIETEGKGISNNVSREEFAPSPKPDIGIMPPQQDSGDGSKIVVNVNLSIETTKFDESVISIENLIKTHNGFIAQSNTYSNGGSYGERTHRVASYTIRIPKENLEAFLASSGVVGEVVSKSSSKDDMSKYYQDTESRLNVLKIKEERLLELLDRAEKMEDIITLENTLNDVIYEKESLMGTLQSIDDRVSYSTVYVNVSEVERVEKPVTVETSFAEKIGNTFVKSIANAKHFFESIILGIIYALPVFVVVPIILAGLVILTKKGIKMISQRKKPVSEEKTEDEEKLEG